MIHQMWIPLERYFQPFLLAAPVKVRLYPMAARLATLHRARAIVGS